MGLRTPPPNGSYERPLISACQVVFDPTAGPRERRPRLQFRWQNVLEAHTKIPRPNGLNRICLPPLRNTRSTAVET